MVRLDSRRLSLMESSLFPVLVISDGLQGGFPYFDDLRLLDIRRLLHFVFGARNYSRCRNESALRLNPAREEGSPRRTPGGFPKPRDVGDLI